ncbi:Hypothetical_protein [Hexamita inflata]|uniref:Hypothetical_protein n=1 Tax=Hexamita inflata TaxID=28002 RepID=A0AA86P488_9EUKA|nr:Hypothetical protein HINF_LOCUS19324 [Hexamita inflata]
MEEYHKHGLQGILQFQQVNRMLNAMLLNPSTKDWAQNTLNVLYSQTPDIEATQQWYKKHYFDAYQKEFDELNAIASKITKNDSFQDLKDKVGIRIQVYVFFSKRPRTSRIRNTLQKPTNFQQFLKGCCICLQRLQQHRNFECHSIGNVFSC